MLQQRSKRTLEKQKTKVWSLDVRKVDPPQAQESTLESKRRRLLRYKREEKPCDVLQVVFSLASITGLHNAAALKSSQQWALTSPSGLF